MGLDSKNAAARQGSVMAAAVPTLPQVMPEKLPIDQLCRLTMLESWAKATTISVMAEQM